ncbi:LLM class flavin-dependent oxidoreductase [Dictyobacter formicarum]|uniref:LLM class F420-dependent oxidoreductase n=1 Tax=Dictyobacter formicarum TaxID=2778368 RepID=A0ABQ3VJV3_9CHLR|nr:LLM class flavin-dependent oxidoreductase [Dictyobacter formicarum]GHO85883.1 LLM class F420-dependent oxidoreductase [Dictyobacter formicarum]
MQNEHVMQPSGSPFASKPARERVGLVVDGSNAAQAVQTIVAAEKVGVRQIWMTQSPLNPDTLSILAAAAIPTTSIRLGTAIIPTYPRHPLTMALQALAINDLAPGRLRLGIGPSHRPTIEGMYGIPVVKPLEHLREYVEIVRAGLWQGKIEHQGNFFHVNATLPRTAEIPILISTLRVGAFQLAGEIADGALPWLCPVPYLLKTAIPALRQSAARHGRSAPPVVAHVLVAMSDDRQAALSATRKQIERYGKLPFYANMFADAGFPVGPGGVMSEDLINSLVISGTPDAIVARFNELLSSGLDELLVLQVPVKDAASERAQLAQLIGQL